MYARLYVDRLTVNRVTPNDDRDEVYFVVNGSIDTFGGAQNIRIPRVPQPPHTHNGNDYYGLHAAEVATDIDEIANPMTLWEGYLWNNDSIGLAILVREQDASVSISSILRSLGQVGAGIATGNVGGIITSLTAFTADTIDQVNKDHQETVGAFNLAMKNEGGNVTFGWGAVPGLSATGPVGGAGPQAQISCTGSNANYTVQVAVQQWFQIDAKHSGMSLDVAGDVLTSGAAVQQYPFHGGNNQLWEIVPVGGDWVRIERASRSGVERHSGLCLDVAFASTDDGADVNQYPWHGGENQQWKLEDAGDALKRIVNRKSGKCLDIRSASMSEHGRLQQYTWHGGENQRFWVH
jgi:hypothetical protein